MSETKMLTIEFVQQSSGECGEAELRIMELQDERDTAIRERDESRFIAEKKHDYLEKQQTAIRELEAQLAVKDSTISDLREADKRAVKIAAGQVEEVKRELEAQLKEANARIADFEMLLHECPDCGATTNFIGKGLYECWKCTEAEVREKWKTVEAREAALKEENERLRGVLQRIVKRVQGCTPIVATDVREMAQAALRAEREVEERQAEVDTTADTEGAKGDKCESLT